MKRLEAKRHLFGDEGLNTEFFKELQDSF